MRWADLELVFQISRQGSATAAAKSMGLSQSTVSRRLAGLERDLGIQLFERRGPQLTPTAAATALVAEAEPLEMRVTQALRRLQQDGDSPAEPVRLSTLRPLLGLLLPTLAELLRKHPDLVIHVDTRSSAANLGRAEADIALRATSSPPETLIGRKVARFAYGLYRQRGACHGEEVVGFPAPRGDILARDWLQGLFDEPSVRLRIDADELHANAAALGIGAAQVLCFVGDKHPQLERVPQAPIEWALDCWVLTHETLQNAPRVRLVFDAVVATMARLRPLIEGQEPSAPSTG